MVGLIEKLQFREDSGTGGCVGRRELSLWKEPPGQRWDLFFNLQTVQYFS